MGENEEHWGCSHPVFPSEKYNNFGQSTRTGNRLFLGYLVYSTLGWSLHFFAHSSPFPPLPGYFPKFLLMQEPWEIADPACLKIGECFLYQEKQIDDEM